MPEILPAEAGEITLEHGVPGRPHAGKVLAAIQPHSDDIPLFAAGTVAKLINEGYTGYLIRTSNDEKAGTGNCVGEVILNNEQDNAAVAKVLGLKKVFDLNYRNHRMEDVSRQEMRARLIYLFRLLRVDTILTFDPWAPYETNPDHFVTAQVVESACWMAGMNRDYPEHMAGGLEPHTVEERYYFSRLGYRAIPRLINRIVDVTSTINVKVEANLVNRTQGPAGENGARLRAELASRKLYLPILGNDDETANREYIRHFVLDIDSERLRKTPSDREVGRRYGFEWAESFHYMGPVDAKLDRYIKEHAVPLST